MTVVQSVYFCSVLAAHLLVVWCSASVYQARCLVNNDIVAIKMLDLEALTSPLDDIMREAQTMKVLQGSSSSSSTTSSMSNTQQQDH
jgi:hypothetical protein